MSTGTRSIFCFLSRTCVNGLIRFNSKGAFNNSLHHTRKGVAPSTLRSILRMWSRILRTVSFRCADYREILSAASSRDLVFLDPPYAATKGRYRQDAFDTDSFIAELDRLNRVGVRWVLTYDGSAGLRDYLGTIPAELFTHRLALPTGHSPFTRLMKSSLDAVVESVYLNFEPPREILRKFSERAFKPSQIDSGSATPPGCDVEQYTLLAAEELHR